MTGQPNDGDRPLSKPVSHVQHSAQSVPSQTGVPLRWLPPRPWGFWATLGWALLTIVMYYFIIFVVVFVFALGLEIFAELLGWRSKINTFDYMEPITLVAYTFAVVGCLALLLLLASVRRIPLREYFGLKRLHGREMAICVLLLLLGFAAVDFSLWSLNRPIVSDTDIQFFKGCGVLRFAFITLVLAPLFEEMWYRGFIFKGIAASKAGPIPAILLSALPWALMHTQYGWLRILGIFIMGLFLGTVRWKTGSTTLTIALHSLANLLITAEIIVAVEVFGRAAAGW